MKKVLSVLISITILIVSATGTLSVYADEPDSNAQEYAATADAEENTAADSLPQRDIIKVTGINKVISKTPGTEISDSIKLSKFDGITIKLQRYNSKTKKWSTKKTIKPAGNTVRIVYPSKYTKALLSQWRIYIPQTDTNEKYISDTITISRRNIKKLSLYSKTAVIIDAQSGAVLYSKNANKKLPMASTTKMMTALLTIENCEPDDILTVTSTAAKTEYGCLNMKSGEQFYVEDMMTAMLLPSSNDAAAALAVHTGGSIKGFADMMNKKAKELGLKNTHFVNPHGLHNKNHYSSAYDLALLHNQLIKEDRYLKAAQKKTFTFYNTNKSKKYSVKNTNSLLGYSGTIAGKTGFTTPAGYTFSGAFKYNGKTYVYAVLGSKTINGRWSDCKTLMNYVKSNI